MRDFLSALKNRRSVYAITKASPISDEQIRQLLEQAVLHSPSSFNMQSARAVLLLGAQHDKLWTLTKQTLAQVVPAENFGPTEKKIAAFAAGYGTVLYFDDTLVTKQYAEKFKTYKDNFPVWAQQASAILQFNVWTLFEEAGLGASLQHYNPLIDGQVKDAWKIPAHWQLIAQMPFGAPSAAPGEKTFLPLADRVKVYE